METTDNLKSKFKFELKELVEKKCWNVSFRPGSAIISLGIGEKILIEKSSATSEEPKYKSTYGLFITCVWRFDSDVKVICGAWDDNLECLNRLIGEKVIDVIVLEPGLDLIIKFSGNFFLNVFCDQTNRKDNDDNYTLFTPSESITSGCSSEISIKSRN